MAAEFFIEFRGFYATALLKQMTELACGLLVKDSLLLKEAESVGSKDLGPFVTV